MKEDWEGLVRNQNAYFQLAFVAGACIWAYALFKLGSATFGVLGGVIAFVLSPAVFFLAPFTAWLFFPKGLMIFFYSCVFMALGAWLYSHFTRKRIYDEQGNEP